MSFNYDTFPIVSVSEAVRRNPPTCRASDAEMEQVVQRWLAIEVVADSVERFVHLSMRIDGTAIHVPDSAMDTVNFTAMLVPKVGRLQTFENGTSIAIPS